MAFGICLELKKVTVVKTAMAFGICLELKKVTGLQMAMDLRACRRCMRSKLYWLQEFHPTHNDFLLHTNRNRFPMNRPIQENPCTRNELRDRSTHIQYHNSNAVPIF